MIFGGEETALFAERISLSALFAVPGILKSVVTENRAKVNFREDGEWCVVVRPVMRRYPPGRDGQDQNC